MQTRVSTSGQVQLPDRVRKRLGIRAGDALRIDVEGSRIVLTAQASPKLKALIAEDPLTGLPVLDFEGDDVPVLTSREIAEILSDFP